MKTITIGCDKTALEMSYESFRLCRSAARNEVDHCLVSKLLQEIGIPVKLNYRKPNFN